MKQLVLLWLVLVWASPLWADSREIGSWHLGGVVFRKNVVVKAIADPKVKGVVCHFAYVEKKLSLEDPSDTSLACRKVAERVEFLAPLSSSEEGEVVFKDARDPFFKTFRIRRLYDPISNVLIYTSYTKELIEGSNKLSISSVVLGQDVPPLVK